MRLVYKSFLCAFVLVLTVQQTRAQSPNNQVSEKLNTYSKNTLQEKIFVHTDKDFYVAGEILWFKAYCTDAFIHRPVSLSKIAYVELLDSSANAVLQAKVSLDELNGNGSFFLPVTIPSGAYTLRAYTNWMKNFPAEYFFYKKISVVNTRSGESTVKTVEPIAEPQISFFPEGGNLVARPAKYDWI